MNRRLHIPSITARIGESLALSDAQAHHARDVLRLENGTDVELFDDAGLIAIATIDRCDASGVALRILSITEAPTNHASITIASAIPKGDRADWMIEKLSEIGVSEFVPLVAQRSVTIPAGQNKIDRWRRIATEAAKQSRRVGVMHIAPIVSLDHWLSQSRSMRVAILSTAPGSRSIFDWFNDHHHEPLPNSVALLIGPEGGWTNEELQLCKSANCVAVKLTPTILRVETAAIVAAGIIAALTIGEFQ